MSGNQERPEMDEWVYLLHSGEGNDPRDAKKWRDALLKRSPKSAPKLVTELKLARLTERHSIVALYRKDGDQELTAAPPVLARDCWRVQGEDGIVDPAAFYRALSANILPATVKARRETEEDLGYVKLGYA